MRENQTYKYNNKPIAWRKVFSIAFVTSGYPVKAPIRFDTALPGVFNVARRTVAKYREQMNIPVARLRRKIGDKSNGI